MTATFSDVITSQSELRQLLGQPSERAVAKELDHLDQHCQTFIARSPFLLISSSNAAGHLDISPKGDPAGFVRVLDDRTIAIPDRKGNRRADTFNNVIENPQVGLYFLVPGYQESLRVTGTARVVRDSWLLESMAERGVVPALALVVAVRDAFYHCAKCVIRSGLWDPQNWGDVSGMPTLGKVLADQTRSTLAVPEIEAQIAESYVKNLY